MNLTSSYLLRSLRCLDSLKDSGGRSTQRGIATRQATHAPFKTCLPFLVLQLHQPCPECVVLAREVGHLDTQGVHLRETVPIRGCELPHGVFKPGERSLRDRSAPPPKRECGRSHDERLLQPRPCSRRDPRPRHRQQHHPERPCACSVSLHRRIHSLEERRQRESPLPRAEQAARSRSPREPQPSVPG